MQGPKRDTVTSGQGPSLDSSEVPAARRKAYVYIQQSVPGQASAQKLIHWWRLVVAGGGQGGQQKRFLPALPEKSGVEAANPVAVVAVVMVFLVMVVRVTLLSWWWLLLSLGFLMRYAATCGLTVTTRYWFLGSAARPSSCKQQTSAGVQVVHRSHRRQRSR